jgi:hypothetical protein
MTWRVISKQILLTRVYLLLCCSCSCWGVISQNTAAFAKFDQFHHASPAVGRQHISKTVALCFGDLGTYHVLVYYFGTSTFFGVTLVLLTGICLHQFYIGCHVLALVFATISSRHFFLGLTKLSQMRCK